MGKFGENLIQKCYSYLLQKDQNTFIIVGKLNIEIKVISMSEMDYNTPAKGLISQK
jgi:hypothetical protein